MNYKYLKMILEKYVSYKDSLYTKKIAIVIIK